MIMNKILPSFTSHRSRIKGEKLEILKHEILPKYEITSFFDVQHFNKIHIEIGAGTGDTVSHLAKQNPDILFIACEVYIDGISGICNKVQSQNLTNVRIYTQDARILLNQIPNNTLECLYLLFPDPWPKKKHHKRRIVTQEFIQEISHILRKDGRLFIATDHDSYKEHICQVIYKQNYMDWIAEKPEDFTQEPTWWTKTKFQKKAEESGRVPVFFTLKPKCE